jgi:hypothetical protein
VYPERVKLDIQYEIDGFEKTTLTRLLSSFDTIDVEASAKRQEFLEAKSISFDPERDDEVCIEENGFFEELNHVVIEEALKQEFLNSTVTWLFHLFERQRIRVYGTHLTNPLKIKLRENNYDLDTCQDWRVLNKELRYAANAIKHGSKSDAMNDLIKHYPNLIHSDKVVITKNDVERFLSALRVFWSKALHNQVVL